MQLTIISGENVASLEVASDMELENFLALCKLELDTIANIAFDKLVLNFNGRQMVPKDELLKRTLQELNIQNEDAIHIHIVPTSASSAPTTSFIQPANPTTSTPNNQVSSIISSLVQGIRVPSKQPAADRDRVMANNIFEACAQAHRLDFLRVEHPELAAAYEANPNDPEAFHAAFLKYKEETARRARVMQDETSEEGQRYIQELIQRQNIEYMHEFAMEHMPEAFVPVHMLYIRMKINNHPVIAFVDSGAQVSILSESTAKRCGIIQIVDRRFRAQASGIGGLQKMLGRIHQCQVQVHDHVFPCPFDVMGDRDMDILLGLNVLLRHKCSIDLQRMVLRFGDGTETPFLSEAEFQREKEAVHNDEAAQGSKQ